MFKLKYKGQEIGLDTDCCIEWDSVKTNSTDTPAGWSVSNEKIARFVIAEHMIKFKKESAGHPDYMRIVDVEMDREYTVFDFIDEILKKHPKDYGRIDIDGKISYEYKNGVLDWALIPQELFNRVVENVEGMSSYYHTDYKLTLKGNKPKEEVDLEEKKDMFKLIPRSFDVEIPFNATLEELIGWIASREGAREGNVRINCSNYYFNKEHPIDFFAYICPFRECLVTKAIYSNHNGKYLYDIMIKMPDISTDTEYDKVVDIMFDDFERAKEELLRLAPLKWARLNAKAAKDLLNKLKGVRDD
jgi:hypothetical protein